MRIEYSVGIVIFVLVSILMVNDTAADIAFTDITVQAGIDNTAKGDCVAFVDYNRDGYVDIYVGNSGLEDSPLGKPNLLYRNNGDGTFTDVAAEAGVADARQTIGAAFGDFDNDGDLDLYLANDFGINALYLNKGDDTFEDITDAAGVKGAIDIIGGEEVPNGFGVALADYDNDGYLDIYAVNLGGGNILYRNSGDGTFVDSSAEADVKAGTGIQGAGRAAVFSDFNNDGKLDLYAINGYEKLSFFYLNSDSGFHDATNEAGIGELEHGAGVAFGDYDNDGDMDLYVTNLDSTQSVPLPNVLYRNNGKGVFEDVTAEAGLVFEEYSLGAVFGDLDNDGHLDLYVVTNGGLNILYRNNGDGTFTDVTASAGVGDEGWGSNAALGDIDNDGYLDIYLANTASFYDEMGDTDVLYRNNGGDNHWLQLQLLGTPSNCAAIGARVTVSAGNLYQVREVSGGRGHDQDSLIVSFGLGTYEVADTVEVMWPSGEVQKLTDLPADQRVVIEERPASVQPHDRYISAWGKIKQADTDSSGEMLNSVFSSAVGQNYPNPFNPETWIPYQLSRSSSVVISIYSSTGQLVKQLDMGHQSAGTYLERQKAAYWDGTNTAGEGMSSGVYFYHIQTDGFTDIRKMLLSR